MVDVVLPQEVAGEDAEHLAELVADPEVPQFLDRVHSIIEVIQTLQKCGLIDLEFLQHFLTVGVALADEAEHRFDEIFYNVFGLAFFYFLGLLLL